jgi:hypothetical protein
MIERDTSKINITWNIATYMTMIVVAKIDGSKKIDIETPRTNAIA